MIVRVSMDDSLLSDPRARRLMTITGLSLKQMLGTLFLVWLPCYTRKTPNLPKDEVDICADHDGFCEAMLKSKMAIDNGDGTVYMAGAEERLAFLLSQREKGKASADARARKRSEQIALPVGSPSEAGPSGEPPGSNPGSIPGSTGPVPGSAGVQPSSLDLSPDLDLSPETQSQSLPAFADLSRQKGPKGYSIHQRQTARVLLELLNEKRRQFTGKDLTIGTDAVVRICALFVKGYTFDDIRSVILFREREVQRDREALKWFDTVSPFRPENFERALGMASSSVRSLPSKNGAGGGGGGGGGARAFVPSFGPELPSRQGQAK